ncbi:MAG TPA: MBL fold metallo-hydrolase, partial [Ignavibacteria bacterium]|nr:MBL fold metallo-hydrolase [Ignavibacteria bacterium]
MDNKTESVSLIILGTVQDAGSPHIGCAKICCKDLFSNPDHNRKVVSIGIIDKINSKTFLFDATPDITSQLQNLETHSGSISKIVPDGIFLTHAHIGHYTGLMYLGREAMNSKNAEVYVMPRMKNFLESNSPWDQLVDMKNIRLNLLKNEICVELTDAIKVTPFLVPHRDEFSETVGYKIEGPSKKVLFIPDIDKWDKWERNIIREIESVDYAFLDATFYDENETGNSGMSEIPHPFITESMDLFKNIPAEEKIKI